MNKNLQWKLTTIAVVFVAFFAVGVYPILAERFHLPIPGFLKARQLKLGLDLKGGVHLILRVNTDDALRLTSQSTSEQLRASLATSGITPTAIDVPSVTTFRVEGVPSDRDSQFRAAADEVASANYDRNPLPGGTYEFKLRPNIERDLREQAIDQTQQTIERRVNDLGVSETTIARQSNGEMIMVQLPGVSDVARAKEIIGKTALLEFKLVEAGPSSKEDLLKQYNNVVPNDMEVLPGSGDTGSAYYLVKKIAPVSGQDLRVARPGLDENNQPAVHFELKPAGAQAFGKLSGENLGRYLAIVLDDRIISAPRLEGRIDYQGRISGGFTSETANDLALTLRSGALPASLTYEEERVIGPSLGADSIRSGLTASVAGLLFVVIFMVVYYRRAGFNALTSILANLLILLGMMAYVGAAMTLPGFAGFILTIGIGVDSNVLIFERIKEELDAGKTVRSAVSAGFDRVWATIVDTHVASLIAAVFLFNFGTGPIRGFATTLMIGLASNVFTAVFVSRTMFEIYLTRRGRDAALSI